MIRKLSPCLLLAATASSFAADRSRALRAQFQRLNPCPSTGAPHGPCPGYQVNHIDALICGGHDEMSTLQWLPTEPHKAKTRVEVKLCRAQ